MVSVPSKVVRVRGALATRSRLVVLRLPLDGPRMFGKLRERVDLSVAGGGRH